MSNESKRIIIEYINSNKLEVEKPKITEKNNKDN